MSDEDTNYLRIHELTKKVNSMEVELRALASFIQNKFPGEIAPEFAGDAGELGAAEDLNPIPIIYGEPQETADAPPVNPQETAHVEPRQTK